MAQRKFTPARTFAPVHDIDGERVTPIRREDGRMEYMATLHEQLISYEDAPDTALRAIRDVVADRRSDLAATLADEAADADALLDEADAVLIIGCAVDEPLPFEVCHE